MSRTLHTSAAVITVQGNASAQTNVNLQYYLQWTVGPAKQLILAALGASSSRGSIEIYDKDDNLYVSADGLVSAPYRIILPSVWNRVDNAAGLDNIALVVNDQPAGVSEDLATKTLLVTVDDVTFSSGRIHMDFHGKMANAFIQMAETIYGPAPLGVTLAGNGVVSIDINFAVLPT